jgi:hypothetical protein
MTAARSSALDRLEAPESRIYDFARGAATRNGKFTIHVWANTLCWPHVTRKSPDYSREYAEHWARYMTLEVAAITYQVLTAMQPDGTDYVSFMAYKTLAARSRVSVRTVATVMAHVRKSSAPLFFYRKEGSTRGIRHECYRFTAVMDPIAFAKARDEARDVEQSRLRVREDASRLEALRLQANELKGTISTAEMKAGITAIHEAARGKLPRNVARQASRYRATLGSAA